jgi:hypothetical protein
MTARVEWDSFSDEEQQALHAWANIALAEGRPVLPGRDLILLPAIDVLNAEAHGVPLDLTWCLERDDGREVYIFRLPDGWDR